MAWAAHIPDVRAGQATDLRRCTERGLGLGSSSQTISQSSCRSRTGIPHSPPRKERFRHGAEDGSASSKSMASSICSAAAFSKPSQTSRAAGLKRTSATVTDARCAARPGGVALRVTAAFLYLGHDLRRQVVAAGVLVHMLEALVILEADHTAAGAP